jgi:hypothetical protein
VALVSLHPYKFSISVSLLLLIYEIKKWRVRVCSMEMIFCMKARHPHFPLLKESSVFSAKRKLPMNMEKLSNTKCIDKVYIYSCFEQAISCYALQD